MQIDLDLILETFFAEAEEQLLRMEEAAVALEVHPDDPELTAEIFRVVHTIKGNAGSLGFDAMAELCHQVEEPLGRLRDAGETVGAGMVTYLLAAVDTLRRMLREAAARREGGAQSLEAGLEVASHRPARTLRVDLGKLDRLLDLTGEIAVARGRLADALGNGAGLTHREILEVHAELDPLHAQLQEMVTELRLVAVGPLFRQQIRTLRDVCQLEEKVARLVLVGEDVEVDATIIEHLRDPLTHLVRNAAHHGIEGPKERLARGKDPCGTLTLRARHASGQLVVEVADDGAGPDRPRIEARARELGLAAEPEKLADADLYRFVLEPGFSTAGEVTGVSGRGVGLDVVRRNAEALRGSVALTGEAGKGTTVVLRLPLTLALIEGLAVGAGGETFVLPLDQVVECGEGRAGLAVDAVHGRSQTVIKPLGRLFSAVQGISGSAILGNGRVALILDVPALLREAVRSHEAVMSAGI